MEELISPKELSSLLKVSRPWPYVMVKRGLLSCYKMGKAVRFRRSDIEDYLERSKVEGKGENSNGEHYGANGKSKIIDH